jgi:sirohydrochlorin cobaltochelatase
MNALPQDCGLLLVGHGTRSEPGTQQFLQLSGELARHIAPTSLEPAFLEIQQPRIREAIGRLLTAGIQKLIVMPLLLFAAGHAKRDIPDAVTSALTSCGQADLPLLQTAPLGLHRAVLELSQRRMAEARAGRESGAGDCGSGAREESCLLMVGRGSPDESATTEMQEFAKLRQQQEGGLPTEIAFLAMARPLLEEQLRQVAAANYRIVIVQPHLLFAGELAESLHQQVSAIAKAHSKTDWLVTPLLADALGEVGLGTELLLEAMVDRCAEVAADWH